MPEAPSRRFARPTAVGAGRKLHKSVGSRARTPFIGDELSDPGRGSVEIYLRGELLAAAEISVPTSSMPGCRSTVRSCQLSAALQATLPFGGRHFTDDRTG
jgi:hypothetical protein